MYKVLHLNGDVERFERVMKVLDKQSNVRYEDTRALVMVKSKDAKDKMFLVFYEGNEQESGVYRPCIFLSNNIDENAQELSEEKFIRFVCDLYPKQEEFKHGHVYMGTFVTNRVKYTGLVLCTRKKLVIDAFESMTIEYLKMDQCENIVDVTPIEQLRRLNELI